MTPKSKLRAQTLTHWQDYWSAQELGPNTSNGHCDYRISALSFGLPWGLSGKESACNAGDTGEMGLIPASGSSLGGWHGQPAPLFLQENPMDRGAWRATAHRVAKSRTGLKRLSGYACTSSNCLSHTHLSAPPDFPWLFPSLSSFAPRSAPGPSLPAR